MAAASPTETKDHWDAKAYQTAANFVPQLTTTVVQLLDPQPTDRIIDLGCGDGPLTAALAKRAGRVVGVDASANLIDAAKRDYPPISSSAITQGSKERGVSWHLQDCRYLLHHIRGQHDQHSPATNDISAVLFAGAYDKVFSNAALHWILSETSTRLSVLQAAHKLLKPGGTFVFEMGGAGNVAEAETAFMSVATTIGKLSPAQATAANPWFFPSETLMGNLLSQAGFAVEKLELEYRPTKLTPESNGQGGVEGWVRAFSGAFLEAIPEPKLREDVIAHVCTAVKSVITREEDGSAWLGYVRLRGVARKPVS